MPTYEYACTNGHRFEVVQSFSEEPLTECRECGEPVRRVFHPVGIVLKGSGFYSTDNRGGKKFTPAEKTGSDASKTTTSTESSSTGSSEKKPSGKKSESA